MIDFSDVTYCPLAMSIPDELVKSAYEEVKRAETRFKSIYRTCEMIPIYTPGGAIAKDRIRSSKDKLMWTPEAQKMATLKDLLETFFFSVMHPLPRVLVLVTPPRGEVKLHIDCSKDYVDKLQLKLRLVFSGDRSGLWFLGDSKSRNFIDGQHSLYVIDGSHPHGMVNESSDPKYTLCLGSPWTGEIGAEFHSLLERSFHQFNESVILRSDIGRPIHDDLFQDSVESLIQQNSRDPRDDLL